MEKQKITIPSWVELENYCAKHDCDNCVFSKRITKNSDKVCLQGAFYRFIDACKQFEEIFGK